MFVVAKEDPRTPYGWIFFQYFGEEDIYKYAVNTYFPDEAAIFKTKELAAKHYWEICRMFNGYKIYPYVIFNKETETCR